MSSAKRMREKRKRDKASGMVRVEFPNVHKLDVKALRKHAAKLRAERESRTDAESEGK